MWFGSIAFGASASFLGKILMSYRIIVMQIAGILIIVFGLQMSGLLKFKLLMKKESTQIPFFIHSKRTPA
ncbi:MAG: cytochrome c biogenesis protein CcdA [Bacillus sp. (in: firmicutes)]